MACLRRADCKPFGARATLQEVLMRYAVERVCVCVLAHDTGMRMPMRG